MNVTANAFLPTSTFIDGVNLMNAGFLNDGIIPTATTSTIGGILKATQSQFEGGTGDTAAITAKLLGDAFLYIASENIGFGNFSGGSFKIGDMIINFGKVTLFVPSIIVEETINLSSISTTRAYTNSAYTVMLTTSDSSHAPLLGWSVTSQANTTFDVHSSDQGGETTEGFYFFTVGEA